MRCSSCRVFTGPVCGACRAGHWILGILQSGQVPLLEERRVTGLLRGVAGELADLVESSQLSGGPAPRAGSPGKGGTKDLTPGSVEPAGGAEDKAKEPSEYSYVEDEGEEEEHVADDPPEGAGPSVPAPEKPVKEEQQEDQDKPPTPEAAKEEGDRGGGRRGREVRILPAAAGSQQDPHYLSRALQLYPTGKAAARGPRRSEPSEEAPKIHSGSRGDTRTSRARKAPRAWSERRPDGGRHGAGERPGDSRRSRQSEAARSPDRPPLVRRPRDPREERRRAKKKKKNNKGQKRRERGREFRARRFQDSNQRGRW